MAKGFKQLTYTDRLMIDKLVRQKYRQIEIAKIIGVSRQTIYNETHRCTYEHKNTDWTYETRYNPEGAQILADENKSNRGTQLKIGNDLKYADYLEKMVLENDYSPAAVLGQIKTQGKEKEFKTKICVSTFYSYIDKGIFLKLTNKDLPVKKNEKREYNKIKRTPKRTNSGESIEKRPKEVESRQEFGNWEMDSVIGKKGISKSTLLVLTERKTRAEIIIKLPNHTSAAVVEAIDKIEYKYKNHFRDIFKTITVDNGSEFARCPELEKSVFGDFRRTKLYYCHAYSSWERGTNENTNKMIRRKFPKGYNFDDKTQEEIEAIQEWINNYPRRIHQYHSASELFNNELSNIA